MKHNQKGFLTIDFIFAAVIFFVFASVLFSFAITFSVAEVVQYATFSGARSYSLGDVDQEAQVQRGEDKFNGLMANRNFRPLINNGWFALGDVQVGAFPDRASGNDRATDADTFSGIIVQFNAPILFKRVPLLGTTASNPDGFLADIQSFLGREPTQGECQDFSTQRINFIQQEYTDTDVSAYAVQMDNGC